MPRAGRYFLPDQPLHVIQRGNNRAAVFFDTEDYRRYRGWLAEAATANGCAIHAYVFMTNHVHLLVTPQSADSLPRTMQSLGRRYVRYINDAYRRTGTLWEGRYRAAPIDSEAYFLSCSRYIELNPVRAGMVAHPGDYGWSSYRAQALGQPDALLQQHALYRALGPVPRARQDAYRQLFDAPLDAAFVDELRAATNGGWAMGDERFKAQIARALGRRVEPAAPGRPSAERGDGRQTKLI